jgi:hypothetical protein
MAMRNSISRLILVLVLPLAADAQVERLVIGQDGLDWRESSQDLLGLDDSVTIGSLQPFELDPLINIGVGPKTEKGQSTNILGYVWGSDSPTADRRVPGRQMPPPASVEDKTAWVYGSWGSASTIDGDVDQPTHSWVVNGYTFDLGLVVPLNRVVFFPPERGRGAAGPYLGLLFRDLFPRQYVVSGSLNPQEFLFSDPSNDFNQLLSSDLSHDEQVADARFPTQFLRFTRVRFPEPGFVAEVEFYGEGFLPETRYTSQLLDMGEPVNFGRLQYDFEVYRSSGSGGEPALAPDAPVQIAIEVRSGRDETPLVYHIIDELRREIVAAFEDWDKAPRKLDRGFPGQQGAVEDDLANWSFWSVPHYTAGEGIRVPDGRQFIQLRASITSEEVFAFGRLNSLSIEYSPLLANPLVGEVALVEDPHPTGGVAEVPLGEPVMLTYDVRADFSSETQTGFNAIRLQTPEAADLQRFEMGEPLVIVEPDSVTVNDRELVVHFPSHPVNRTSNQPVRLTFATQVFNYITMFEGEAFQIGGENLPQSIDGGDATSLVSTDGLQVFTPLQRLEVLAGVDLGARVLTPNGDGVHDELEVSFTLQGIEAAVVDVSIYDLGGRLVRRLVDGEMRSEGRYRDVWDGMGDRGLVAPGLYLARVAVDTDLGTFEQTQSMAVAY